MFQKLNCCRQKYSQDYIYLLTQMKGDAVDICGEKCCLSSMIISSKILIFVYNHMGQVGSKVLQNFTIIYVRRSMQLYKTHSDISKERKK